MAYTKPYLDASCPAVRAEFRGLDIQHSAVAALRVEVRFTVILEAGRRKAAVAAVDRLYPGAYTRPLSSSS